MTNPSSTDSRQGLTIEILPGCVAWWVFGGTVQQNIQVLSSEAAELLVIALLSTAEQNHVGLQRVAHIWQCWDTIKGIMQRKNTAFCNREISRALNLQPDLKGNSTNFTHKSV